MGQCCEGATASSDSSNGGVSSTLKQNKKKRPSKKQTLSVINKNNETEGKSSVKNSHPLKVCSPKKVKKHQHSPPNKEQFVIKLKGKVKEVKMHNKSSKIILYKSCISKSIILKAPMNKKLNDKSIKTQQLKQNDNDLQTKTTLELAKMERAPAIKIVFDEERIIEQILERENLQKELMTNKVVGGDDDNINNNNIDNDIIISYLGSGGGSNSGLSTLSSSSISKASNQKHSHHKNHHNSNKHQQHLQANNKVAKTIKAKGGSKSVVVNDKSSINDFDISSSNSSNTSDIGSNASNS